MILSAREVFREAAMVTFIALFLIQFCCLEPIKGPSLEDLAKEKSPKKMVHAWAAAMFRGDAVTVKAGFDLTTEEGRAAADAAQILPRFIRSSQKLAEAARRKYGEEGVKAVEKALNAKLGQIDWKALKPTIDGIKIYFAEDGETAVARMAGDKQDWKYTELVRKLGRWFIAPAKEPEGAKLTAGLFEVFVIGQFEKAAGIVEQSKSLDEARTSLEQMRKDMEQGSEK
jgi:hypothetical protein